MPSAPLGTLMRQIRRLIGSEPLGDATDAQLLEQFRAQQDEAAFTALVQRYGPLVLGVCRRVLHDSHEAEDAFQATFFVLARRAPAIRNPGSLPSWLHGAAVRVAQRARLGKIRRQTIETQVPTMAGADAQAYREPEARDQDAPSAACHRELRSVLDEELAQLPDKYRLPMVLCYLEGKTNEEAARQLGWTKGTVSGQLARARDLLRTRLVRRGLVFPAGVLAVALEETAAPAAAVPVSLVESTVTSGLLFAAGKAAVDSATGAALAQGVLRTITLSKVKWVAILLPVMLLIGSGTSVGYHVWRGLRPAAPTMTAPREAKPADVLPPAAALDAKLRGQKVLVAFDGFAPEGLDELGPGGLTGNQHRQIEIRKSFEKAGIEVVEEVRLGLILTDTKGRKPADVLKHVPHHVGAVVFQDGDYRESIPYEDRHGHLLAPAPYAAIRYGSPGGASADVRKKDLEMHSKMLGVVAEEFQERPGVYTGLKLTPAKGKTLLDVFLLTKAGFHYTPKEKP